MNRVGSFYYGKSYICEDDNEMSSEEETLNSDVLPRSWTSFPDHIDGFKVSGKKCNKHIKAMDELSYNNVNKIREMALKNEPLLDVKEESHRTLFEQRLMANSRHLNELKVFSEELLTNFWVDVDCRTANYRQINKYKFAKLLETIQNESAESNDKYQSIVTYWSKLNRIKEPFLMWNKMQNQQGVFNDIMKSKDDLIELCESELQRLNIQYNIDMMRQANSLSCLMERVDHQIEIMKRAYKRYVELLAQTMEAECQLYAINANKKWRIFFNSMNISIINKSEVLKYFDQFFHEEANRIAKNQLLLTNATRIRLHKDTEQLRLDLLAIKHEMVLNAHITYYNYEILKRRQDENTIIVNQQKSKLRSLFEKVQILKEKKCDFQRKFACKKISLTRTLRRLHSIIGFLETHWFELNMVSKNKFDKIWDINYNELMTNGKTIIKVDQLLHKYTLYMSYGEPAFVRKNINNVYKYDPIFKRKHQIKQKTKDFKSVPISQMRLIRNIFRKLTNRSDFLIEDCMFNIIEPLQSKDEFLIRLDTVFAALHVESVDDVLELIEVFKNYAYCPNCQSARERETSIEILYREAYKYKDLSMFSVFPMGLQAAIKLRRSIYSPYRKPIGADKKLNAKCPNHYLIMEPTLVRLAMAIYCIKRNTPLYDPTKYMESFIQMHEHEMSQFWNTFRDIIPESKFKLWKLIEYYLNKYSEILKLRQIYDADVINLRRQVTELQHMLKVYKVEF